MTKYSPIAVYYIGDAGLKIIPYPDDYPIKIDYKWLIKRHWWEFWKPKWIYLSEPLDYSTKKSGVEK